MSTIAITLPYKGKTLNKNIQSKVTPAIALEWLKEGNRRFLENRRMERDLHVQVAETAAGQYPFAVILSCIDSRIPTETIFDKGIGDIFNIRIAGNFVNKDILGSMEFACKIAGSKLVVVMGHTACGAVKGACDQAELGNLTQMLGKIAPAVDAVHTPHGADRSSQNAEFVNEVARKNVELAIGKIKAQSPLLAEQHQNGEIDIVGAMYDVHTGEVTFLDNPNQ
ncbi:MAG: carbonic anhydrase [Lewinella sp.]|nr:carbonic anhydrase [Lewinella sp.]